MSFKKIQVTNINICCEFEILKNFNNIKFSTNYHKIQQNCFLIFEIIREKLIRME